MPHAEAETDRIPGQSGLLLILSAPSGAGKTSLYQALLERVEGVVASVSHTTRSPRPGETDGTDYHFVDPNEFERLVAAGAFLEHARVFDRAYGTSRESVARERAAGNDVVLEIDWQGARQVRERVPDAVSVFVLPPSRPVLRERLEGRGQDDAEVIERRMREAEAEISHYAEYDYVIVNDDFEDALASLMAVFRAERCRLVHRRESLDAFAERLMGKIDENGGES
ncbi:guanylate kinase [Thiohalorhabdus sp.]|uniref:guanylate kinase n=1 Tax=Thiohalorhabdus sp. TaxID=3094134 RepID=UPI002FC33626